MGVTKKRKKGQKTRTRAGSSSKYGARYGAKHKHKAAKLKSTKRHQVCPQCGRNSLNKKGFVWVCTKCGATAIGGMYTMQTALGKVIDKLFGKKVTKKEIKEISEKIEQVQDETKDKVPEKQGKPKIEKETKKPEEK